MLYLRPSSDFVDDARRSKHTTNKPVGTIFLNQYPRLPVQVEMNWYSSGYRKLYATSHGS